MNPCSVQYIVHWADNLIRRINNIKQELYPPFWTCRNGDFPIILVKLKLLRNYCRNNFSISSIITNSGIWITTLKHNDLLPKSLFGKQHEFEYQFSSNALFNWKFPKSLTYANPLLRNTKLLCIYKLINETNRKLSKDTASWIKAWTGPWHCLLSVIRTPARVINLNQT